MTTLNDSKFVQVINNNLNVFKLKFVFLILIFNERFMGLH